MTSQIMKKTHKDSYMVRFHLTSNLARQVFDSGSHLIILQVMTLPEKEFLAEVVKREDYLKGGE